MWGYFVADLGWKAIATNHGRVIPIVFTLAQIRPDSWEIIWQSLS